VKILEMKSTFYIADGLSRRFGNSKEITAEDVADTSGTIGNQYGLDAP